MGRSAVRMGHPDRNARAAIRIRINCSQGEVARYLRDYLDSVEAFEAGADLHAFQQSKGEPDDSTGSHTRPGLLPGKWAVQLPGWVIQAKDVSAPVLQLSQYPLLTLAYPVKYRLRATRRRPRRTWTVSSIALPGRSTRRRRASASRWRSVRSPPQRGIPARTGSIRPCTGRMIRTRARLGSGPSSAPRRTSSCTGSARSTTSRTYRGRPRERTDHNNECTHMQRTELHTEELWVAQIADCCVLPTKLPGYDKATNLGVLRVRWLYSQNHVLQLHDDRGRIDSSYTRRVRQCKFKSHEASRRFALGDGM